MLVWQLDSLWISEDMFLALDKDMNGTLSKQELREYADGTLTDIFIERGMKLNLTSCGLSENAIILKFLYISSYLNLAS